MKKKELFTVLTASLMCAAAAVTFAACGGEEKTYTVGYLASGLTGETGDVPTDDTKYKKGDEVTVKGNEGNLKVAGQTFEGWKYGGKTYTEGQKIKMPAKNIMLTASFSPISSCTITYVLGEGGSWTSPDVAPETSVAKDTEITLPGLDDVKKDGQEVTGWTIGEETLDPGASYTVTGDVTISAVWGTQKHAVSYVGNRLQGQVENGGRHEADTKITVIGVPEEWKSETKEFQGWEYTISAEEGDDGAVKNENDEWVITTIYQPDDEFTVPAGGATLKAKWNYVGVYVKFIADRNDFETEPKTVLYKPGQEAAFAAEVPALTATAPEDTETHWIYENSYLENETSYIEYVVCDMGAQTLALLSSAITAGIEEVEVYGECSKIVPSLTLNAWDTVASSVHFQYGQKVTLTADVNVTGNLVHMGAFGYLANATNAAVNTKLRWDWWFSDAAGNGKDQEKYEALEVTQAKNVVITKNDEIVENTADLLISLFPNISNFQIVADYTTEGTIVITVSFSSYTVDADDNYDSYSYTGTATYGVLNPHVGLAQRYSFGIGGEGVTVKNVKFIVEGEVDTITPPEHPTHDWTAESNYVCSICGDVDPAHPHSYDGDDICIYCGKPNPSHIHRYTKGICTVCGGVEVYAEGGDYTAVGATAINVGPTKIATDTIKVDNNAITLAKGKTMVILGTQTQDFANHENLSWFSLIFEFDEGYTLRSDNAGWAFPGVTNFAGHTGDDYSINYAEGKTKGDDNWADFRLIAADCNWCVVIDWTGDNPVVSLYMTAKSGSLEGCTYQCTYTVNITEGNTMSVVTPKIGGDHLDAYTVDGYKVID